MSLGSTVHNFRAALRGCSVAFTTMFARPVVLLFWIIGSQEIRNCKEAVAFSGKMLVPCWMKICHFADCVFGGWHDYSGLVIQNKVKEVQDLRFSQRCWRLNFLGYDALFVYKLSPNIWRRLLLPYSASGLFRPRRWRQKPDPTYGGTKLRNVRCFPVYMAYYRRRLESSR